MSTLQKAVCWPFTSTCIEGGCRASLWVSTFTSTIQIGTFHWATCRQEHSCNKECQSPGICRIETTPKSIEATFTGVHQTFQYTKVWLSSNGCQMYWDSRADYIVVYPGYISIPYCFVQKWILIAFYDSSCPSFTLRSYDTSRPFGTWWAPYTRNPCWPETIISFLWSKVC